MAKLRVKLKQHSPIIHFQAEQEGATLRATELKPKLDKFIVNELKEIEEDLYSKYKDKITKNNFPMDDEKVSSPYKLRVKSDNRKYTLKKNQTAYFGDHKDKALWLDNIEMEIFSFDQQIVQLIKDVLPLFFIYHNFCQRQSKGFGSFSVKKWKFDKGNDWVRCKLSSKIDNLLNKKYKTLFLKEIGKSNFQVDDIGSKYDLFRSLQVKLEQKIGRFYELINPRKPVKFLIEGVEDKTIEELLYFKVNEVVNMIVVADKHANPLDNQISIDLREKIKNRLSKKDSEKKVIDLLSQTSWSDKENKVNKILKTINEDYQILKSGKNFGGYQKSELMDYMYKEKNIRWEKKKIKEKLKEDFNKIFKSLKGDNNRQNQENGDYRYRYIRAMLGLAEHNEYLLNSSDRLIIKIVDKKGEIDRFQSPILFKIFDNKIFVLAEEIPEKMFGRDFKFELAKKDKIIDKDFIKIKAPFEDEFNLKDFLEAKLPELDYKKVGVENG